MKLNIILKRIPNLTQEEEQWLRTTIHNGQQWQDYYKGEYTLIRKDKLAQLRKNQVKPSKPAQTPIYCSTCTTKLKTMPCDSELTYCPQCDLPHQHQEDTQQN